MEGGQRNFCSGSHLALGDEDDRTDGGQTEVQAGVLRQDDALHFSPVPGSPSWDALSFFQEASTLLVIARIHLQRLDTEEAVQKVDAAVKLSRDNNFKETEAAGLRELAAVALREDRELALQLACEAVRAALEGGALEQLVAARRRVEALPPSEQLQLVVAERWGELLAAGGPLDAGRLGLLAALSDPRPPPALRGDFYASFEAAGLCEACCEAVSRCTGRPEGVDAPSASGTWRAARPCAPAWPAPCRSSCRRWTRALRRGVRSSSPRARQRCATCAATRR
ncbi:unnamed protein product [Prorocentrum cordatum]|uniref:Uncharacterized protein n=1 Tax=Prorocentrum cordatum TaxID=2364126 RepID=A0ABN9X1B3_9DINO|nr:unnamed protein product [Polarella glacialis]